MEAGWVVTEVGRQPWIVYNHMKVEDAATANTGVWITFIAVTLLYLALGVTAILVLRGMSRRFRRAGGFAERRRPVRAAGVRRPSRCRGGGGPMSDLVAVVLLLGLTAYAVFGGADFGAGFWDLTAGSPERGAAAARADRALDRTGLGGQPRLADLRLRGHLDGVLGGLRLDHADPLRPAHPRRARHRPARGRASRSASRSSTLRDRRLFGAAFAASSVLVPYCMGAVAGGIASGRVPAGGKAGDPVDSWVNPTSIVTGVLAVAAVAYLAAVYLVWEARRADDAELAEYFRRRALVSAVVVAVVGAVGMVVLHSDAPLRLRRDDRPGAAGRRSSASLCGLGALVLLARDAARGARVLAVLAVAGIVVAWGVAQWPYLLPESLTVSDAAAPSGTLQALVVTVVLAVARSCCPGSCCSTSSTSGACCPRRACPTPPTGATEIVAPADRAPSTTSSRRGDATATARSKVERTATRRLAEDCRRTAT